MNDSKVFSIKLFVSLCAIGERAELYSFLAVKHQNETTDRRFSNEKG